MKAFLDIITNMGVSTEDDILQKRRVRLVNSILTILGFSGLFFSVLFLLIQDYEQALIAIIGTLLICLPTLYFNYKGLHDMAKLYFIVSIWLIYSINSFLLIAQQKSTHTEIVLISLFAMVIILFENHLKTLFCSLYVISFLVLETIKYHYLGWAFDGDYIATIANFSITFLLIYMFTNIFKKDLFKSLDKIKVFNVRLADRQQHIINQSNQLILNHNMKRTLIDNIPMLMAFFDLDGKFLIVNKQYEKAFGIPIKEIEGKYLKDILPADLLKQQDDLFGKACLGINSEFTQKVDFPGGSTKYVYGMYIGVTNSKGSPTAIAHYMSDITQVKEAEEKLKQLNTTKDKLLSIVSHDLKEPIYSLQQLLSLSDAISMEEFTMYMSKIEHQVQTISYTMENILRWVKSQLNGFTSQKKQVDLSKVVSESTKLLMSRIHAKGLKIHNNIKKEDTAYVDEDNIHLVVRNVLSNAIKFTPQGGSIDLKVVKTDNFIQLIISDTGIGMHEEKINDMKNSTFSISNEGTEGEKGTGLGLIFCKDVLKINNGHLHIESQPNEGTTVVISLPNSETDQTISYQEIATNQHAPVYS